MNVRELKDFLENLPDDFEIEVSANGGEYVFGFDLNELKVNEEFKSITIDCWEIKNAYEFWIRLCCGCINFGITRTVWFHS